MLTSKWTLRLNFIVAIGLLGTATGLLMIFGITQLMWYVVAGQNMIGFAFWIASYLAAAGCVYALYRIGKKLKKKMKEMAT